MERWSNRVGADCLTLATEPRPKRARLIAPAHRQCGDGLADWRVLSTAPRASSAARWAVVMPGRQPVMSIRRSGARAAGCAEKCQCWPPTAAPSHQIRRWPPVARRRTPPRPRPRRCGPVVWPQAARSQNPTSALCHLHRH
jgi:hypothetical protein